MVIRGIFIILLHLALGFGCSELMDGFVPGSVCGMLLLSASLMLGLVKADSVRCVAEWLTGNMAIFFLPAAIGIMDLWGVVSASWWQWLLIVLFSTIAVMAVSGGVQELAERSGNSSASRGAAQVDKKGDGDE